MAEDEANPRVERRVLWEGNIGSFGIDRVALPNDRQVELALLRHTGASAVVPFLDDQERGLFSTRAPARPNAIGLSVVRLLSVSGDTLRVDGIDALDGTPLLDIKPYAPGFDAHPNSRAGWLDSVKGKRKLADRRFSVSSDDDQD